MPGDLKIALSSIQGFNALGEPALSELVGFMSTRVVRAGETIFCQGEPSPFCFGVLAGEILIQHVSKDNRFPPKVLGVLGPGSIFGESAIFEESPRAAMATAGKDGKLAVIRGQPLREWIAKNPQAGQPLLLSLLRSTVGRLHVTSQELAIVYGVGRLLGSEKPFLEQLPLVLDFLKGSLNGLDDMIFYRRSAYWDEFTPLLAIPALSEPAAISIESDFIKRAAEAGAPQSLEAKDRELFMAESKLPWSSRAAMAFIPLFDWDKTQDPLQGLLVLASAGRPEAFTGDKQLLLTSLVLPIAEALSRFARHEDSEAEDRLRQNKRSIPQ